MKTTAILSEIIAHIRTYALASFEEKNLQHDLQSILQRLQTRQYAETDFIDRNSFDAGKRTEEFFHYIEGYIHQSNTWATILQPVLNQFTIHSITDICPGWAPKIEFALCQLSFNGTVTLFDQEKRSITKLIELLEHIRPTYTTKIVIDNFLSESSKPQSDLTVCNHIIDDLLLSLYSEKSGVSLSEIYHNENAFLKATDTIIKDTNAYTTFPKKFLYHINKFVPNGGIFIMRHYPGLTESSLRAINWIKYCMKILVSIDALFIQMGYIHIGKPTNEVFVFQKR